MEDWPWESAGVLRSPQSSPMRSSPLQSSSSQSIHEEDMALQRTLDVGAGVTGGSTGVNSSRTSSLVETLQSCLTSLPGRSLVRSPSRSTPKILSPSNFKKRRARPSRRMPTTVVEATSINFRDIVQRLTGISAINPPALVEPWQQSSPEQFTPLPSSNKRDIEAGSPPRITKSIPFPISGNSIETSRSLSRWWDSAAHEQSQINIYPDPNSLANEPIIDTIGPPNILSPAAPLIKLPEDKYNELSMSQFDAGVQFDAGDHHSAIPDRMSLASHERRRAAASEVSMPEANKSIDITCQDLDATGSPELEGLDQARSVQDLCNTYIQVGRFEDFCDAQGILGEEMTEIGRGRLTAALFQRAFYHHLETLLKAPKSFKAYLPHLFKEAANLVVKDLPYATRILQVGESQSFQFFDEVYDGDPVDVDVVFSLGGLVAVCQKFSEAEERGKHLEPGLAIEYCIVYHDLTSTYLRRRVRTKALEDRLIEDATGVLGVEVTDEDIHVEIIRDDGSYYFGTLKDFAYPFVKNHGGEAMDKQCATKIFGHLKGAEFLSAKEYGLKCSPLLAISLIIAIRRENSSLKWNMTHGHMEIENSKDVEFEKLKWQILYTDKINELGLAVEWGMEQVLSLDMASSQVAGTSRYSQEIQALASVFGNAVQQKRNFGFQLNLPGGVGAGGSIDIFGSKGKDLAKEAHLRIMERLWTQESKFVETSNLDARHARVKDDLLQGRLPDAPYNYLIVWDDANNGHVSVYLASEDGKLEWITDILLPGGKGEHTKLFKSRLKGLRMEVKRDGSKLVSTHARKSTVDLVSRFKKSKQLNIDNCMIQVPPGLQSNDEWVHLIGPQAKYSGNKFLWEATHMRAIVSSRTSYSSGALLETFALNSDKFGEIGYCERGKCDALVHLCDKVVAWGQFSKAPASLLEGANLIKWGGLIDENNLC